MAADPDAAIAAANAAVLGRLAAVHPLWTAVRPASEALGLTRRCLLHAGPPLAQLDHLPPPLHSSAVLACLYEGWAEDEATAEALLRSGEVALRPAQSAGAVTPLAAVISPRTALVEIADLSPHNPRRAWAPLGSGTGAQIRFGTRNRAVLPRLAWRDEVLAGFFLQVLAAGPIDLDALAKSGLAGGDELHARCTAASAALRETLRPWRDELPQGAAIDAMLEATPLFFLTPWMAACHLMLDTAADGGRDAASTLIVGFAGNGADCGIRVAGCPDRWWTAPATPPEGPLFDPETLADAAPMIGDSGAIDAAGYGAYALPGADAELRITLHDWMPDDWARRARQQLAHIDDAPGRAALDAAAVVASGEPAHALIAMLDAEGRQGLLGRGVVTAPLPPFAAAVEFVRNGASRHG